MLLLVRSGITWLRQNLDRRSLASAGIALIAAVFLRQATELSLPSQLALGAVLLAALAVLAWLLLPQLLGPVFFYDLVRTSRRQRYFLFRAGYAGGLLIVIFLFYASWFDSS